MVRKRLVCLSALYVAACAPSLAADPAMQPAPPACAPSQQSALPKCAPPVVASHNAVVVSHNGDLRLHPRHSWVGDHTAGVAYGLTPGLGMNGAAGFGYHAVDNCWSYNLVYDRFGNYLGEQPTNICLALPPN